MSSWRGSTGGGGGQPGGNRRGQDRGGGGSRAPAEGRGSSRERALGQSSEGLVAEVGQRSGDGRSGGGRARERGTERVVIRTDRDDQSGGNQESGRQDRGGRDVAGKASKKLGEISKKVFDQLSPRKGGRKKSDREREKEPVKASSSWDVLGGPKSTAFGNASVPSLGSGSAKGKGKAKAAGETLDLHPEGPGAKGDVIPAVEVESPALDLPSEIPVSSVPRPSFISERPSVPVRTQSEESILSYHSEKVFDPLGRERYFLKTSNPAGRRKLFEHLGASSESARMLMIIPGQGGTFGFGDHFTTETGREVSGHQLLRHHDNTKHVSFFGTNLQLIGTVKCVSCTAIYFEIKGNRVFCAHVNTWHNPDKYEVPFLKSNDPEHKEIKKAVYRRLILHAEEYGWDPKKDVYKNTLTVVCPQPDAQAYAVPEALRKFLGLDYTPYVHKGHGFVMTPGARGPDDCPVGQVLQVTWGFMKSEDRKRDGTYGYVRDAFPEGLKWISYKHSNNEHVLQQWCYTVGQQWHHIEPNYDSRFGRRIPVDENTTVQKFATWNTMSQGGEEVPITVERDNSFKENDGGCYWQYTGDTGELFAVQAPGR